jgi:hypothetical protein
MKKFVLIIMVVVFIVGMLISCSQSICPAYSSNNDTEQVEKNV